jgi:16S rRNA (adenine1518-N6/adenine1519-N6)-dimethyltransferase
MRIPARKSLGQHFLTDRRAIERIADALDILPTDTVVEVGPGRGALTDVLAERAGRVVAIEYDRALVPLLRERYAARGTVEIIEADVLSVTLADAAGGVPYKLAGNVPYYITTPILFHALRRPRPDVAVYLVQKEVADRIVAPAGSDAYGALSVNVQAVATPELILRVPAGAFRPPPKVDSAVIRIVPRSDPVVTAAEEEGFRRFVMAAFGMRRKQVQKVLRSVRPIDTAAALAVLEAVGVEPAIRIEMLDARTVAAIYRAVTALGVPDGAGLP